MNIVIRRAYRTDLPAIHNLVRELAIYERAEDEFVASLEDYRRDFNDGLFDALVAEVDDEVAGMALFYMAYSTWKGRMLYLEDFVIRKENRRQGLGQRLFDAVVKEARQRECRLVKWQVLDWNQPALDFYARQDAAIERDWWNGKYFLD